MRTVKVLRDELREAHRREQRLLDMLRELNDRLAAAHANPWTLPPRPAREKPEDEIARDYGDLEEL